MATRDKTRARANRLGAYDGARRGSRGAWTPLTPIHREGAPSRAFPPPC
jgi:hypothetical protein